MRVTISISKSEMAEMVKERLELSLPEDCKMETAQEMDAAGKLTAFVFLFDTAQN